MVSFGQIEDSVYLLKQTDAMTEKTYVFGSRRIICSDESGDIGFIISTHIDYKKMKFEMITAQMVGIGTCNEKDYIIILFENGEKVTLLSWNEFNCKGIAYFNLFDKRAIELLRTQPMSKIRMTNGRSNESYTSDVKVGDKRYFMQIFYALDNKLITEIK